VPLQTTPTQENFGKKKKTKNIASYKSIEQENNKLTKKKKKEK